MNTTTAPVSWARGYERGRIGETSSYIGHESEEAAIEDAISCLASRGVTSAWVRPVYPGWKLGDVTWKREKAKRTGSAA